MEWSRWFFVLCLSWACFIQSTHELQSYQFQVLLQLRKHLEYPSQLDIWETYNGDLCNLPPTSRMSITCQANLISEVRVMGDRLFKVRDFNGFAIPNVTLSENFSIESFVTTLTRLSRLRVLSLVSLGIWGPLPDKIHRLTSLEVLDLSYNFMSGLVPSHLSRISKLNSLTLDGNYFNGTIPDSLSSLTNLSVLRLKCNKLSGEFPSSIREIKTLTDIVLSRNMLSGQLPDLSSLTSLHLLDLRENRFDFDLPVMPKGLVTVLLSNNSFSGKIPEEFGTLNQLQHVDLSLNYLSGTPPSSLFSLPNVSYLNLASNSLSGSLSKDLHCGDNLGFVDISMNKLVGRLPSCLDNFSAKTVVKYSGNCLSINERDQHQQSYCNEASVVGGHLTNKAVKILVAAVVGAVLVIALLALAVFFLRRRYRNSRRRLEHNVSFLVLQEYATSGFSSEILANARYIAEASKLGTQGVPICRAFSLEELKDATDNFNASVLIGEGSYGKVYKGRLGNGTYVAVRSFPLLKKHSIQNIKVRLDLLSKLRHPHLVALLGHCIDGNGQDDTDKNKVFLIYEYVPNGTYRSHLSESFPEKILNWSDRLSILISVAKALHFLHTGVIPATFNNQLKANNILLDENNIPKLSDYGMPIITEDIEKLEGKKDGQRSRHTLNLEDDVYNFGFILLESLVGAIVSGKGESFLLNEMESFGSQDGRRKIVDPIVLKTSSQESLSIVVAITGKCISPEKSVRPSFEDVLWNLQYAAQVQATADSDQKPDSATSYTCTLIGNNLAEPQGLQAHLT